MTDREEINTLLEKRKPFAVTEEMPNIWQRLKLQKREYTIELKPFPLGVLYQVTDCLMEIEGLPKNNASIKERAAFISRNKDVVTKTIAYALNNNSDKEPSEWLLKFIKRNLPANQVYHIMLFITYQSDIGNFTNATALATQRLVAKNSKAEQK